MKKTYLFDVRLFASIRVPAENLADARRQLRDKIECAECNFGTWENGDPIIAEATIDDDCPELIEVEQESAA